MQSVVFTETAGDGEADLFCDGISLAKYLMAWDCAAVYPDGEYQWGAADGGAQGSAAVVGPILSGDRNADFPYVLHRGIPEAACQEGGFVGERNIDRFLVGLQWILEQVMAGFGGVLEKLGWMNQGYWLSPLSWLNPYKSVSGGVVAIQSLLCIGIAAAGIVIGLKGYERRRIGQVS